MEIRQIWAAAYRNARLERRRAKALDAEVKAKAEEIIIQMVEREIWGESVGFPEVVREARAEQEKAKNLLRRFAPTKKPDTQSGGGQYYRLLPFAQTCSPRRKAVRSIAICKVTGRAFKWAEGRFVHTSGLGGLVLEGIKAFEETAGAECFPHNLVYTAMSGALAVGSSPIGHGGWKFSPEGADVLLREYGRIRGWLVAAGKLPALQKVILKTQSNKGVNSFRTKLWMGLLWGKFPSPGALERKLWAVKVRAERILSAYDGNIKPSWTHLMYGLLNERRVGKAALIAAALQLGWNGVDERDGHWDDHSLRAGQFRSAYRAARDWLVEHRSAAYLLEDKSDGVAVRLATEPAYNRHGIEVSRALQVDEWGQRKLLWLVRFGERTFHAERPSEVFVGYDEQCLVSGAVVAVSDAIEAWRRQDVLRAESSEIIGFLTGEGGDTCPLFTRADSYRAGNCAAGTDAFLRARGWKHRQFVSGADLLPHLDDERVRRVIVGRMTQMAAAS